MNMIFIVKAIIGLSVLGFAAWQDVKKREVEDKVWLFSIPAVFSLSIYEVALGEPGLISLIASPAFAVSIGILFNYLGLYGGADVKALLLIACTFPFYPSSLIFPLWRAFPLPFLTVVFTATLFSAAYPITVFILNLISIFSGRNPLEEINVNGIFEKILLLMTTRKISVEELGKSLKYFPAEKIVFENGSLKRIPVLFVHAEADVDEMAEEIIKYKDEIGGEVLASPTVPMVALFEIAAILLFLVFLFLSPF